MYHDELSHRWRAFINLLCTPLEENLSESYGQNMLPRKVELKKKKKDIPFSKNDYGRI